MPFDALPTLESRLHGNPVHGVPLSRPALGPRQREPVVQQRIDARGGILGRGGDDERRRVFAMIQRSDYVRITDIRQKDLPPDPWERGFSVRGY